MDVDALKRKIAFDYMELMDFAIKGKMHSLEFIKQEIQVVKLNITDDKIIKYYISNTWRM